MDFDLFGPSSGSPSAQPPTTTAQVPRSGSAPTGAPVQLPVPPTPTLGADQLQQLMLQMLNNQNTGAPVQLPVPPTPTLGADQLQQLMLQMLNNQNTALQQQQNHT
eukprot:s10585_g1.t1